MRDAFVLKIVAHLLSSLPDNNGRHNCVVRNSDLIGKFAYTTALQCDPDGTWWCVWSFHSDTESDSSRGMADTPLGDRFADKNGYLLLVWGYDKFETIRK